MVSRRDFLKIGGSSILASSLGLELVKSGYADDQLLTNFKIKYAKETFTICPYCGVGCGIIVHTEKGKVINTEGDSDHPINQGSLCSKGNALYQIANNERRLQKVKYRAAGSNVWEEKDWDWAITEIAKRIKNTRDKTFKTNDKDKTVNYTDAIVNLGGAALVNEECYLISKFSRALGLVNVEHQARLCHSSTVPALAESFGRGAMTNHWIDLKNSDCFLIIGSNSAENHPMSFKWITKAVEERGAKIISVDPRFTRTSSKAHIYAKMRSGTDIAFIGGMINYILENNLYQKEYVKIHTNANFLVDPNYKFEDGLFSGFDQEKKSYDKSTWKYQLDDNGIPKKDLTLKNPNCVFQILKKHYSRYTIETVCNITGTPQDIYKKVCQTFSATGVPNKVGTILYAMGATQHTHGVQNIRAYAILQLLLGNIGCAGGGINALRGESNVQGSTDFGLLFHILPGYLKTPISDDISLEKYLERVTPKTKDPKSANWWQNTPKYIVSLLKAYWGEFAKKENDFCFQYLPKVNGNYSFMSIFEEMYKGTIKGLLSWGMNPAVGGSNLNLEQKALEKLDWLVAIDLWETETSIFWKRPGVNPNDIKTEVFLLPAASSVEKQGSISNSGRWVQWRWKAVNPVGDAKDDLWIVNNLMLKIKDLYQKEKGVFSDPIIKLNWDYGKEPDVHKVAKEINGYALKTYTEKDQTINAGEQIPAFGFLKDDGSTACGNWLYSGYYTQKGNMATRRDNQDTSNGLGLYSNWSWCWPVNRRIIYNRASCDANGNPWDNTRALVKWVNDKWVGDVPDGPWPPADKYAFIMRPEGVGCLFGPGLNDGPFPEHYEPFESPVKNILSNQQYTPAVHIYKAELDKVGNSKDFPIIATTFRVSEHWQTGAMTRNLPWLCELMPEAFVEISTELAKEKGIKNKDKVKIISARGEITVVAVVTNRLQPFVLKEKTVHQIAIPWHWGYAGISTGDSANKLTHHIGDVNTRIPEYKVFLCNIEKV